MQPPFDDAQEVEVRRKSVEEPHGDEAATGLQCGKVALQEGAAHEVHHQRHASAVGRPQRSGHEVLRPVVDDRLRPTGSHGLHLLPGPHGGDDRRTHVRRQLHHRETDAARGRVHEHGLSGAQAAEGEERLVSGQERLRGGGRAVHIQRVWHCIGHPLVEEAVLGEAAALDHPEDPLSDRESTDVLAPRLHGAGDLHARDRALAAGHVIFALALQEVASIQRSRVHAHQQGIAPRHRPRDLPDPDHLGPSGPLVDHRAHGHQRTSMRAQYPASASMPAVSVGTRKLRSNERKSSPVDFRPVVSQVTMPWPGREPDSRLARMRLSA